MKFPTSRSPRSGYSHRMRRLTAALAPIVAEPLERRQLLSINSLSFTAPPTTTNVGTLIDSPLGIQVSVPSTGQGGGTDSITMSLGANPGGAVLGGTVTETAVNGVAVFPDLWINVPRNGYTLVATDNTNPAIQSVTSASFNIDALPRVNPLMSLTQGPAGLNPSSTLAKDSSGNLYGLTFTGGLYNMGTIYELSGPNHSTYTTLVSLSYPVTNSYSSLGTLVIDQSGNLYGTHGNTVFELSANHTTLTTLATFTGTSGTTLGNDPNGLTIDSNGDLFGTTAFGGVDGFNGLGTIFEITASHQFINLLNFTGSTGAYLGATPLGTLAMDSSGNLYGTTEFTSYEAGVNNTDGTVFELAANHQTFTTLVSFTGSSGAYPGENPQGSLAIDQYGNLFGTTAETTEYNTRGDGTVFELAANHTTFTSLFTFTGSSGNYPGSGPQSLVVDSSGNLYGATGASIFELAANHTTFTTLQSFSETGNQPLSGPSVAVSLDNSGNLYAVTTGAGASGNGSAVEFSGPGHATVTTLYDFPAGNPTNPQGSLAVDRYGNIYGLTPDTIFELSAPDYSTYTTLYTFPGVTNAYTGELIVDPSGNLYGYAENTIFEFSANHTYTPLFTLGTANAPGIGLEGLTLDSSGNIYGTTANGGADNFGTVFEISANHQTYTTLFSFTGETTGGSYPGAYPYGGITLDNSGNLYGTTGWGGGDIGGSVGDGTIWELSANHTTFTTLYTFDENFRPSGTMVIDSSGNLYGTAQYEDGGIIFELSASDVYTGLYGFPGSPTESVVPEGNLAIDPAGNLYGATVPSSGIDVDTIYELSADHSTFTSLAILNATLGAGTPGAISDGIGNVFVSTPNGGTYGQGSITEIAADGTNNLVGNSGVTTIAPPLGVPPFAAETFASISIAAGATVATTLSPTGHTVLTVNTLSLAGSAGAWTGTLDLTNNDLDITGESLATITSQVEQGYNNGTWTGQGISSSTAATDSTHLTALGVMQNNQSGSPLYSATNPLDGTIPGAGDVLVKYTYYGDANLDGKVDASDYSLIDNGYLNHLTGWFNGDFNYDGIVNGSDYTLIDNAFNMQGASLAAEISPAASLTKSRPQTQFAASFSQTTIGSTPGFAGGAATTANSAAGPFSWDDFLSRSKKKKRIEL